MKNIDEATVKAFDDKWAAVYGGTRNPERARKNFEAYFRMFPFDELRGAEGFDLGCGQGHHAAVVAKRVGRLHCIDPSPSGLAVAKHDMVNLPNVEFHLADVDNIPLRDGSQDFGYSMGGSTTFQIRRLRRRAARRN